MGCATYRPAERNTPQILAGLITQTYGILSILIESVHLTRMGILHLERALRYSDHGIPLVGRSLGLLQGQGVDVE